LFSDVASLLFQFAVLLREFAGAGIEFAACYVSPQTRELSSQACYVSSQTRELVIAAREDVVTARLYVVASLRTEKTTRDEHVTARLYVVASLRTEKALCKNTSRRVYT
jgi:hypothetical protein